MYQHKRTQIDPNLMHSMRHIRWNRARANATYATFVTDATYVRKKKSRKREKCGKWITWLG